MDIRFAAGELAVAQRQDLAERLTAIMIQMEGGAGTEGGRGFATVLLTEVPEGCWWVGGRADSRYVSGSGRFLAQVFIPEGYMDQAHKTGVQTDVTSAILAATGIADADAHSIQVVINEVTEGNWAAGGKTISIASIADTVGLSKAGGRFQWVRDYFAAKTRQFAAAGYPAGVGGLLPDQSKEPV